MDDITLQSLSLAIGSMVMRCQVILSALHAGEPVEGEDEEHLPELAIDLEKAIAEQGEEYTRLRDDSGLWPTFDELVEAHRG